MKSKIYSSLFAFFATFSLLYAQEGPTSYQVQKIPPNPDVADLGKFGDVPVNKYNGTANISVPIHTVELDGLRIPLALRYNTGGVRVNQDASWVGLGWSLSEGISITREINGFEDIRDASFETQSVGWIYSDIPNLYFEPVAPDFTFERNYDELFDLENEYHANKPPDTEPDIFTVSLPTGSCKFYLPKIVGSENVLMGVLLDEEGYKVEFDITTQNFEIVDRGGFRYHFDVQESSTGFNTSGSINSQDKQAALQGIHYGTASAKKVITSWKVSKVVSPFGNEINFEHQDGFFFSYPHYEERHTLLINSGNTSATPPIASSSLPVGPNISASLTAFDVKYLTEINGDFGALRFNLAAREDLFSKGEKERLASEVSGTWDPLITPNTYNAQKLDNVQLVDLNNQVVKTYQLAYDYFNNHMLSDDDKVSHIRLKLDRVDVNDQTYAFEYHQPNALPIKDSRSIDFWGFYNGVSNSTVIPHMNRFFLVHGLIGGNQVFFERFHEFSGGSRKSDIDFGKIGNLSKITYPTGGYSDFEYEGNTVTLKKPSYSSSYFAHLDAGLVNDFQQTDQISGITSTGDYNFRYLYLKLANDPGFSLYDQNDCDVTSSTVSPSQTFDITTLSCRRMAYNFKVTTDMNCSTGCGDLSSYQPAPSHLAVWIEEVNTSQTYPLRYFTNNSGDFGTEEHEVLLPVGTYELKSISWGVGPSPTIVINASALGGTYWNTTSTTEEVYEEFEVGGSRIKTLTNSDHDGTFLSKKTYNYDHAIANGSISSSGLLMDDLVHSSRLFSSLEYTPEFFSTQYSDDFPVITSSNSARTNLSASGSHLGYSLVTERSVNESGVSNGKTVTLFSNTENSYLIRNLGNAIQVNAYSGQGTPAQSHYDLNSISSSVTIPYGDVYVLGTSPVTSGHINGQMLNESLYDASDVLVNSVDHTYEAYEGNTDFLATPPGSSSSNYGSHNFHFPRLIYTGQGAVAGVFPITQPFDKLRLEDYGRHLSQRLKSSTTKSFLSGNEFSQTVEYFYDNDKRFVSQTQATNSTGSLNTSKYYYPEDLTSTPLMTDLVNENRLEVKIKSEQFEGTSANPEETQTFAEETKYSNTINGSAHVLPYEVVTNRGAGGTDYQRVVYDRYDDKGHLIQYRQKADDVPITLVWSYNEQYPVAKIENATFQQVATALGVTEAVLMTFYHANINTLDALRTSLPDSRVYTYTYDPLVGMTTATDPNGKTTSYEYDSSGRLQRIRDHESNILQEYHYQYAETNE